MSNLEPPLYTKLNLSITQFLEGQGCSLISSKKLPFRQSTVFLSPEFPRFGRLAYSLYILFLSQQERLCSRVVGGSCRSEEFL